MAILNRQDMDLLIYNRKGRGKKINTKNINTKKHLQNKMAFTIFFQTQELTLREVLGTERHSV